MSEKERKSMRGCCGEESNGQACPCKKRICLPILGLAALAIVARVVAKRKGRK